MTIELFKKSTHFELLLKLLAVPSITPRDDGALPLLRDYLASRGFANHLVEFSDSAEEPVVNLYAQIGSGGRNLCFAGHTDVVPPGDLSAWADEPFTPYLRDNRLYGRGVVDMKAAICAFIGACERFLTMNPDFIVNGEGRISFLLTGDEEGLAINGSCKLLEWIYQRGYNLDFCVIGEPVTLAKIGDNVKVGARGSLNFELQCFGEQGHVAYNTMAKNAGKSLVRVLNELLNYDFDHGNSLLAQERGRELLSGQSGADREKGNWLSPHDLASTPGQRDSTDGLNEHALAPIKFEATNLEITHISIENRATNVIPGLARAHFNIRYNAAHHPDHIVAQVRDILCNTLRQEEFNLHYDNPSAVFFNNIPENLRLMVSEAIYSVNGVRPDFNTKGGSSDGKFIYKYCPVLEIGLRSETAHKANENADLQDIYDLEQIYLNILLRFFKKEPFRQVTT